jgi:hypothetical protein
LSCREEIRKVPKRYAMPMLGSFGNLVVRSLITIDVIIVFPAPKREVCLAVV